MREIKLNDKDAAIVFHADGSRDAFIPTTNDRESVPANGQFVSAIMILLKKDDTFAMYIWEQWCNELRALSENGGNRE